MKLTVNRLQECLDYNRFTGVFIWKINSGRNRLVGRRAGTVVNGYLEIRIDGTRYLAHRLAWLYVYGSWPANQIDHRNTVKLDNWIDNLRLATEVQNKANQSKRKTNTSGFKGVFRSRKKWKSQIKYMGKIMYLGTFATKGEASYAYLLAALRLHGEYARAT